MVRISLISLFIGVAVGAGLAHFFPKSTSVSSSEIPAGSVEHTLALRPALQQIVNAKAGTFAEEYEKIMALPKEEQSMLSYLLARWIDLDPSEAAARLIVDDKVDSEFYFAWAERDATAALQAALSYRENTKRFAVSAVLASLAKHDPRRMIEINGTLPPDLKRSDHLTRAFAHLAEKDPEAALILAATSGDEALKGIATGWAREDPETALAWVEDGHEEHLASVLAEWGKMNPGAALSYLSTKAASFKDYALVRTLLSSQAKEDPIAGLEWAQKIGLNPPDLVGSVIEQLKGSPVENWQFLHEHLHGYTQSEAISELTERWRAQDFKDFIAQTDDLSPEEQSEAREVVLNWGKHHFSEALAYVEGIEEPDRKLKLLSAVMGGAAKSDFRATWDIALELVPSLREHHETAEGISNEEVAMGFLHGDIAHPEAVASQLGFYDPEKGARWMVPHPDSHFFAYRATDMVEKWADRDPRAASEWLATVPPSTARDYAAVGLVKAVAPFDPESAFTWSQEIADQQQRSAALADSFEHLLWTDSDAALNILDSSDLSESDKAVLLEKMEETRE